MSEKKENTGGYDFFILIPTVILLGIGLVAIYSASYYKLDDSYFYLKHQAFFALLGLFFLIIAKNIPVEFYRKMVYPALLISFLMLIILLISSFGREVNGARRWIDIGLFRLQPSEIVKLSLAVYMAYSMSKKGTNMSSFSKGLLPHLLVVGTFMFMILIQPDLGTAVIIGSWLIILLFVAGLNLLHLLGMVIIACPMVIWLITHAEYRLNRLLAFTKPWDHAQDLGFQIIHSFYAFGSGGLLGVGLGNSKQKLGYLPEPHTDFILSILAEELGLLGVIVIIALFGILIIRGIKISLDATDLYSSYLALGITTLLGLQVIINMGVVMGLLPTKGLTLPFLSYGGSSLMVNFIAIGILMRISARSK
ncbi:MAG: putative lipid II flippase FtsW [Deltaproteobacteria bacterium]|nr:putative lipid II flippase FtsW [Deltaproteobacteria bacterium]